MSKMMMNVCGIGIAVFGGLPMLLGVVLLGSLIVLVWVASSSGAAVRQVMKRR